MIGYCNVRGLRGSRFSLEKVSDAYDILLFQETKLRDGSTFEMGNFSFPAEGINNGLAFAVNRNSTCTATLLNPPGYGTEDRQLQILQVCDPRLQRPFFLINIYVRGSTAPEAISWEFLHDLSNAYSDIIIAGDFNARHPTWDSAGTNPNGKGLAEALPDLDLYLLNTGQPTRFAERPGDSDSCIDLTLHSGSLLNKLQWQLGHHVDSDHMLCEIRYQLKHSATDARRKHPYGKTRGNPVWNSIRSHARDKQVPKPLLKRYAPPTWWNQEVDDAWNMKRVKQRALDRARHTHDPEVFKAAKISRNKASAEFRRAASKAYNQRWDSLCQKANLTATDFWHFHRSLDKRMLAPRTPIYDDNGALLVTDEQQGDAFLKRFILQSDHSDADTRAQLLKQLDDMCKLASAPAPFSTQEMHSAIHSSKEGSPGPDRVTIPDFKSLPDSILDRLLLQYNHSLMSGKVPEIWSDAFIGPVPKPGKDHQRLKGYRIIVVQNVIGKIPEKMVARRITKEVEPILPPGMGGYRPQRETWVNPANTSAEIWDGFENKENTLLVALDLEDAYNHVRLPILADRMLRLGISVHCVRWVMAALNRRRCMMKHRSWQSDWTTLNTGLPQGSPLSPVLFNIYTLPLAKLDKPRCRVRTFADDILVSSHGKTPEDVIQIMQPTLTDIQHYCQANHMYCNGDKAEALYCTLNNTFQSTDMPPITYDGQFIQTASKLRHLGVIFDRQLHFTEHVNYILLRGASTPSVLRLVGRLKKDISSCFSTVLCFQLLILPCPHLSLRMTQAGQTPLPP